MKISSGGREGNRATNYIESERNVCHLFLGTFLGLGEHHHSLVHEVDV
jgi:hypothetical protein